MERRTFLNLTAVITAGVAFGSPIKLLSNRKTKVKVILFDAFPIFDPTEVFSMAKKKYPDKGAELINEWKTKQFEYTWLRSMTNSYKDFLAVTEDALVFAANKLQLKLSDTDRAQLINSYYQLKIWPDVEQALAQLNKSGYRLGFLSNFTEKMLEKGVKLSQIENQFEYLISTDRIKKFKPDPGAYQMGQDIFKVEKSEILYVPFAGWDASGAKLFGFETFWLNRLELPIEQLGGRPDGIGKNLNDLLDYLKEK